MMQDKRTVPLSWYVLSVLLVVSLLCFLWMRYTYGTQNIPMDRISHISSISILIKENGIEDEHSISEKDITDSLERALLQCIGQYSMTSAPISVPDSKIISDSYVYISIWIRNKDESSFRINISNNEHHSSVQFDEKYFGIINDSQMLDDIRRVLGQGQ